LSSDSWLFATVAISSAVLIVLLSFLPALGPLIEHIQMYR